MGLNHDRDRHSNRVPRLRVSSLLPQTATDHSPQMRFNTPPTSIKKVMSSDLNHLRNSDTTRFSPHTGALLRQCLHTPKKISCRYLITCSFIRKFLNFNSGLKKYALADRIRRQINCWPGGSFNKSKMTMKQMKAALLNRANGFSTSDPFIEGSPLSSLSATPPAVSTATLPQSQPDAIGIAPHQLAQPGNHGKKLQKDADDSKVCLTIGYRLLKWLQFML